MPLGGISFLAFDVGSVYVRWIMCGSYRGTWPPTCIACQRARRRRHGVGSGLSELVATDSRAPESCAIVSRSETSDNFWSGTSTCARANSAKKRAGAVFSGQRRLNRPHTPYLTCRALSSQLPFWPPWPRKAPSGASRRLRPVLVVVFCARRRLTPPPPAQPMADVRRLPDGLGRAAARADRPRHGGV